MSILGGCNSNILNQTSIISLHGINFNNLNDVSRFHWGNDDMLIFHSFYIHAPILPTWIKFDPSMDR